MTCLSCEQSHCSVDASWVVQSGDSLSSIIKYRSEHEDEQCESVGDNTSATESETQEDVELTGSEFSGGIHLREPSSGDCENDSISRACQWTCRCRDGCVLSVSDVDIISECKTAEFYDKDGVYIETCHGIFLHSQDNRNIYMIQFSPAIPLRTFTAKLVSLGSKQSVWIHSVHFTLTKAQTNTAPFCISNVQAMCKSMGTDIQGFPSSSKMLLQAMQQAVNKNVASNADSCVGGRSGAFNMSSLMQMFAPSLTQSNVMPPTANMTQDILTSLSSASALQKSDHVKHVSEERHSDTENSTTEHAESVVLSEKDSGIRLSPQENSFPESKHDLEQMVDSCVRRHAQTLEKTLKHHISSEVAEMESRIMAKLDQITVEITNKLSG